MPLEPIRALRALTALIRDPDDTAQVFTIIEALSSHAPDRLLRDFRADPTAARLMRARADIVPLLADRDRLRAMPEGSLAHAYLAFVESEGISADGLVQASVDGQTDAQPRSAEQEWIAARLRDTHDLWHTVTGYRGDVLGESALLAFTVPQTKNPAIAMIVLAGLVRMHQSDATRLVLGGYRRGARAARLPVVEWEALLPMPLDEVRARLSIDAPPVYMPIRTSELRAQGMLKARAA